MKLILIVNVLPNTEAIETGVELSLIKLCSIANESLLKRKLGAAPWDLIPTLLFLFIIFKSADIVCCSLL